ncbi:hypothetical protein [Novipirellula galeiformis]|nr:hypothetical protein [Novipirellula galeiformis]
MSAQKSSYVRQNVAHRERDGIDINHGNVNFFSVPLLSHYSGFFP